MNEIKAYKKITALALGEFSLFNEYVGDFMDLFLFFFLSSGTQKATVTKKRVLVMDEVDGMAGNEDRGGVQELIALIKSTKVPIICMCNDRNHPKIRSLANYCFDLRFARPRVEQIRVRTRNFYV